MITTNNSIKCVNCLNNSIIKYQCGKVQCRSCFAHSLIYSMFDSKKSFSSQIKVKCTCSSLTHSYPLTHLLDVINSELNKIYGRKCDQHNLTKAITQCDICKKIMCKDCSLMHHKDCQNFHLSDYIDNGNLIMTNINKSESQIRDILNSNYHSCNRIIDEAISSLESLRRQVANYFTKITSQNLLFFNFLKYLFSFTSKKEIFPKIENIMLDNNFMLNLLNFQMNIKNYTNQILAQSNFIEKKLQYDITKSSFNSITKKETPKVKKVSSLTISSNISCISKIDNINFVIGNEIGQLLVYSIQSKKLILQQSMMTPNQQTIFSICPVDSNSFLVANSMNEIFLYNKIDNNYSLIFKTNFNSKNNDEKISSILSISPQKMVVSSTTSNVKIISYNPQTNTSNIDMVFYTKGYISSIKKANIINNNEVIFGTSRGEIYSWNILNNHCFSIGEAHQDKINSLTLIKDKKLCSSSIDGYSKIWYFSSNNYYENIFTFSENDTICSEIYLDKFLLIKKLDALCIYKIKEMVNKKDKKRIQIINLNEIYEDTDDSDNSIGGKYFFAQVFVFNEKFIFANGPNSIELYENC